MQTYVFHLRRALEPDRVRGTGGGLVTSGRGYVLRVEREQLDAAVFEDGFTAGRAALEAGRYDEAAQRLRTALDLWRGPVLADVADYVFTGLEAAGWRSCSWPRWRPGSTLTWRWAGTTRSPPS